MFIQISVMVWSVSHSYENHSLLLFWLLYVVIKHCFVFSKEEQERLERERQQVEEGELLVEK